MRTAGLLQVDLAKKDGRWERAYHPASTAALPQDFLLKLNKRTKEFYDNLSSANKYAIIYRLTTAKKEETQKRWQERILHMLEKGETFH